MDGIGAVGFGGTPVRNELVPKYRSRDNLLEIKACQSFQGRALRLMLVLPIRNRSFSDGIKKPGVAARL